MSARGGARTYWHLANLGRKPNDYDIATSKLLYYTKTGFEVAVPMADWYRRNQGGSPFQCADWEAFADPRQTTYAAYTALQANQETFIDGLLHAIEGTRYDVDLDPRWVAALDAVIAPMRYPVHGLQMASAYVGSMAPEGRIAVCALFQTGDELRRVHRLAYRQAQLAAVHPGFGERSRQSWQEAPMWQGWREVIERLLVTYDWGEAFVALNLVIKPRFDALLLERVRQLARRRGDDVLERLFFSLADDARWQRSWSAALVKVASQDPGTEAAVAAWRTRWEPLARVGVAALAAGIATLDLGDDWDVAGAIAATEAAAEVAP